MRLDVFEEEPLSQPSEFVEHESGCPAPHFGGQGDYDRKRLAEFFKTYLSLYLKREPLKFVVDHKRVF